jgi:hypothetical protein
MKLLVKANAVKHGSTTAKAASDAAGNTSAAKGTAKGKAPICHTSLGEPVRERVAARRVAAARKRVQEREEGEWTPNRRRARDTDGEVRCCPEEVKNLSCLPRDAHARLRRGCEEVYLVDYHRRPPERSVSTCLAEAFEHVERNNENLGLWSRRRFWCIEAAPHDTDLPRREARKPPLYLRGPHGSYARGASYEHGPATCSSCGRDCRDCLKRLACAHLVSEECASS